VGRGFVVCCRSHVLESNVVACIGGCLRSGEAKAMSAENK
jgi:hypothetical protein